MDQPTKGFLIVASLNKNFLTSAKFCAESIKEYWPEAHITLFTIDEWLEPHLYDVFDTIVGGAPNHKRAKLWALPQTPYDLTVYIDADAEVVHEDIRYIFDCMTDTADIMLTKIRPYNAKITKFAGGELTDHCGLFIYRKTPKVIAFMQEWWDLYYKQSKNEWNWDTTIYPESLRQWDQWTYWWLQNKTDFKIEREYFPDEARWNFVNGNKHSELNGKPIVIYHHTVTPFRIKL